MRELLDTGFELTAHEKVLENVYQKLVQNEKIVSFNAHARVVETLVADFYLTQEGITSMYEKGVQDMLEEYKHNTSRQKYAKSDQYQKFKQAIYVSLSVYVPLRRVTKETWCI